LENPTFAEIVGIRITVHGLTQRAACLRRRPRRIDLQLQNPST
jgi:hypothetical protein